MRQGRLGFWYLLGIALLKPPTVALTRRVTHGTELVPPGGVILAANHISLADPVALCDFVLYDLHRAPRFLAKRELFEGSGLVGRVMRGADQIPVDRHTPDASGALQPAVAALRRGETVVIYPEGTVTLDPGKWPMQARTGVARLALLSGAPVVPVAQWGAQDILDTGRSRRVNLRPRRRVLFRVGPPVDLSRWAGRELTAEVLRGATDAVLDAITAELEVLRGERAPAVRHDPRRTEQRRSA
ncbi:MAG: Acyl-CoA:1-acyl-sn-glycerol-3-phosphate acyltransferase [uncultured Frankineae bacterium]|uniref:Acyl-CoA:1-acyl-sn-glycerol-3-phosphate acyltransferase n=1 Tax=uncultured Frankineae bacterium TaxID=437475 RepID=A0A6J4MLK9_9ACTN|nr:MAG: Acyl-CoA:1-acyl-sn-glycerol-3-phosphate acyltransferase [uncultured Frankineae bacterium]